MFPILLALILAITAKIDVLFNTNGERVVSITKKCSMYLLGSELINK